MDSVEVAVREGDYTSAMVASETRIERLLHERQARRRHHRQSESTDADTPSEQRLIIAANRLPLSARRSHDEPSGWALESSAGGLVSALTGISQSYRITWVGWPGARSPQRSLAPRRSLAPSLFHHLPLQKLLSHVFYTAISTSPRLLGPSSFPEPRTPSESPPRCCSSRSPHAFLFLPHHSSSCKPFR